MKDFITIPELIFQKLQRDSDLRKEKKVRHFRSPRKTEFCGEEEEQRSGSEGRACETRTKAEYATTTRGGAVWKLVGLITRRSQVQILSPLLFQYNIGKRQMITTGRDAATKAHRPKLRFVR